MLRAADGTVDDRSARLIALDWGTSALRGYLLGEDGVVLATRSEPWGIMQLPDGGFVAAFDSMTSEWRTRAPRAPVIAAGMVGSAQGWIEAPYCPSPAGAAELAHALARVDGDRLRIVPGVIQRGRAPNVMRGEETQIVGALASHPELADDALLVLPGTHSKWVRVSDARIREFTTCMTGELFAVLSTGSILGRFARDAGRAPAPDVATDAFSRGVLAARASALGITPLLFSARSLVLTGALAPEASLEYLSGLLIGDEVRCGLADGARPRALVGEPVLCARYVCAMGLFGVEPVPVLGDAAPAGLWAIAQHALLASPTRPNPDA
ncbi:MAG TPA: 2-dehydro-3-deoxygalactonokinase [Gemmatimonadaceae bacterium]|nr:2-dehydro-3-deoxygalactonokinase [Gemmatimonadaceae bacterium]